MLPRKQSFGLRKTSDFAKENIKELSYYLKTVNVQVVSINLYIIFIYSQEIYKYNNIVVIPL